MILSFYLECCIVFNLLLWKRLAPMINWWYHWYFELRYCWDYCLCLSLFHFRHIITLSLSLTILMSFVNYLNFVFHPFCWAYTVTCFFSTCFIKTLLIILDHLNFFKLLPKYPESSHVEIVFIWYLLRLNRQITCLFTIA